MEIAFCRWVCVDGVVLVPDRLGPQNPDCGTTSRFYRRGVAFRFRNRRAASRLPDRASRRWRLAMTATILAPSAFISLASGAKVSLN